MMNVETGLSILDNKTPQLLGRSNYETSLKNCIENAFSLKESMNYKNIENIQTSAHCYFLLPNRQTTDCCYDDLTNLLIDNLTSYVIPRSKIQEIDINNPAEYNKLHREAKKKFIDYWRVKKQLVEKGELDKKTLNSGEAGEVLLFLLAEQILQLPQAICKMSFKTSNSVHVHGSDGIHIGLTEDKNKLALHYGEVKIYKTLSDAIRECLSSITPLLLKEEDEEELNLLNLYSDFGKNEDEVILKEKLKTYFDPEHRNNKILTEIRGICLVGFDEQDAYVLDDIDKTAEIIVQKSQNWLNSFKDKVVENKLEKIVINVFFIPMTSVENFRVFFAQKLGEY